MRVQQLSGVKHRPYCPENTIESIPDHKQSFYCLSILVCQHFRKLCILFPVPPHIMPRSDFNEIARKCHLLGGFGRFSEQYRFLLVVVDINEICQNTSKYAKKCNEFVSFEFIHFEMESYIESLRLIVRNVIVRNVSEIFEFSLRYLRRFCIFPISQKPLKMSKYRVFCLFMTTFAMVVNRYANGQNVLKCSEIRR